MAFQCECGNDEFTAHQVCRIDIIVDGSNQFVRNQGKSTSAAIYDSESPYGPYSCTKCPKEYDELPLRNKVKDSYPNGLCPDCHDSIPDNVVEGQECKNCGHAFFEEQ